MMKSKTLVILGIVIVITIFIISSFLNHPSQAEIKPYTTTPLPRINLTFVKAMWFYSILEFEPEPMKDPERLREDGVNTIAIEIEYRVDAEGKRVTYLGKGFEEEEEQIIAAIRKYKKEGFAIFFFTQLRYMPKAEEFEAQPMAEALRNDTEFFDRFNSFVLHIADIAEKENVEFFAPTNEPDYMMGDERAKVWSQEILPEVRQHFSGKIIYKSASVPSSTVSYFNFSGYDVAGVTIVVLSIGEYNEGEYREMVRNVITELEATAKRDEVLEIWVSGFGTWEGIQNYLNLTERQKADIYQIVFEESKGKVTGLVPWENTFFPLKDTLMEKVIKEWFTKNKE